MLTETLDLHANPCESNEKYIARILSYSRSTCGRSDTHWALQQADPMQGGGVEPSSGFKYILSLSDLQGKAEAVVRATAATSRRTYRNAMLSLGAQDDLLSCLEGVSLYRSSSPSTTGSSKPQAAGEVWRTCFVSTEGTSKCHSSSLKYLMPPVKCLGPYSTSNNRRSACTHGRKSRGFRCQNCHICRLRVSVDEGAKLCDFEQQGREVFSPLAHHTSCDYDAGGILGTSVRAGPNCNSCWALNEYRFYNAVMKTWEPLLTQARSPCVVTVTFLAAYISSNVFCWLALVQGNDHAWASSQCMSCDVAHESNTCRTSSSERIEPFPSLGCKNYCRRFEGGHRNIVRQWAFRWSLTGVNYASLCQNGSWRGYSVSIEQQNSCTQYPWWDTRWIGSLSHNLAYHSPITEKATTLLTCIMPRELSPSQELELSWFYLHVLAYPANLHSMWESLLNFVDKQRLSARWSCRLVSQSPGCLQLEGWLYRNSQPLLARKCPQSASAGWHLSTTLLQPTRARFSGDCRVGLSLKPWLFVLKHSSGQHRSLRCIENIPAYEH